MARFCGIVEQNHQRSKRCKAVVRRK